MTVICILYIFHHPDTSDAIIYVCIVSVFVYLQYVHTDKKQQLIFVSFHKSGLLFLSFSHFTIKQLCIFFAKHRSLLSFCPFYLTDNNYYSFGQDITFLIVRQLDEILVNVF